MVKSLIRWFIIFALSFVVGAAFSIEQGIAFFWVYIAGSALAVILAILIGKATGFVYERTGLLILAGLGLLAIGVIIALLIAGAISAIFKVNFYLAFQILTFIMCFFANNNQNK